MSEAVTPVDHEKIKRLAAMLRNMAPAQNPSATTARPSNAAQPPEPSAAPTTAGPVKEKETSEPECEDLGTGNAAIDRCLAAYERARHGACANGRSHNASSEGKAAYLRALPPLVGSQNVADFIACVMRGSIERIILDYEINKYLYAAQVANCVKTPQQPAPKRQNGRPRTLQYKRGKPAKEVNSSINTAAKS